MPLSEASNYLFIIPKTIIKMAMDLCRVTLLWTNVTDVEVKIIESTGNPVVNFTVATNRRYKNKDGNLVEESEYSRCVAYGNAADILWKYANKGKRMYVEGRLRTRKWEDTTGNVRYTTEIVIDNFIFLDSKPSTVDAASDTAPTAEPEEDLPF